MLAVLLLATGVSAFAQTFPTISQLPTGAPALPQGSATSFTFVVAGDNRPAKSGDPLTQPLLDIVTRLAANPPAFVVWDGDTVYGKQDVGIDTQHAQFLAAFKPLPVPLFNAPGNHEMVVQTMVACGTTSDPYNAELPDFSGSMMASYQKDMAAPFGMFRYGNAAFLIINTDDVLDMTIASACDYNGYVGQAQLAALQATLDQLAADSTVAHVFMFHAPPHQRQRGLPDRHAEGRHVPVRAAGTGVPPSARSGEVLEDDVRLRLARSSAVRRSGAVESERASAAVFNKDRSPGACRTTGSRCSS